MIRPLPRKLGESTVPAAVPFLIVTVIRQWIAQGAPWPDDLLLTVRDAKVGVKARWLGEDDSHQAFDYPELAAEAKAAREEEHRRLFYVALTRTTETLILSSVTFIPVQQAYEMRLGVMGGAVQASRFMNELGPTHPNAIAGNALSPMEEGEGGGDLDDGDCKAGCDCERRVASYPCLRGGLVQHFTPLRL